MTVARALAGFGELRRRSPSPHVTSWPLEELVLTRADGSTLELVVKHIVDGSIERLGFVRDPLREVEVYRLLADERLETPRCYASGESWLALEKVDGVPLWQVGEIETWAAVAGWARRLHERFGDRDLSSHHLLVRDREFYGRWRDRALTRFPAALEPCNAVIDAAITRLSALPSTLVHGELYPSNVLVNGTRIAVVDWEMAGIGPGVIDLAALVTGWPAPEQEAMIAAYGSVDRLDLAAAQLMLALQWLGWVEGWQPPPEHRRNWIAEALAASERMQ